MYDGALSLLVGWCRLVFCRALGRQLGGVIRLWRLSVSIHRAWVVCTFVSLVLLAPCSVLLVLAVNCCVFGRVAVFLLAGR